MGWVVITGGCGYVGSHIAHSIKTNTNHSTLIIDRRAKDLPHTHFTADDIISNDYASDESLRAIGQINPMAIVHCAANSLVGPSMSNPDAYYHNNVIGLIRLLDGMRQHECRNIIFSSSSSIYGNGDGPSREDDVPRPCSPYGTTKLIGEMVLKDYSQSYGINSICFRYFNAIGASPDVGLGQEPNATHLMARLMESIMHDRDFQIYGTDYQTEDGTCVRDYVHVADIADAHVKGMKWLMDNPGHHIYNIGSGTGYSVLEMIKAVEDVTGKKIRVSPHPRRPGDPAWRMADITKISNDLRWEPKKKLEQIVSDAHEWYNSREFKYISR